MPYKKKEQPDFPYKKARLVNCGGDLSKRWYVVYYAWNIETQQLQRKRVYINDNNKTARDRTEEAKKLIKEIDAELIAGAVIDTSEKNEINVDEANLEQTVLIDFNSTSTLEALEFAVELKKSTGRQSTKDTYGSVWKTFSTWLIKNQFASLPLNQINSKHMFAFFDYLRKNHNTKKKGKIGATTFNNYKRVLTTFFNVFIQREIITKNPVHAIKNLQAEEKRNAAFVDVQKKQLKEIFSERNPQLWAFVQIIYYSLMRPNELLNLRVRNVDLKNFNFYIPPNISKSGIARYPKITPPLLKVIEAMELQKYHPDDLLFTKLGTPGPEGLAVGENTFTRWHREILDSFGYGPDYVLYSWKHTGVVDLYRAGVKELFIMQQSGHLDMKSFHKYLRSLGLYSNEELIIKAPEI